MSTIYRKVEATNGRIYHLPAVAADELMKEQEVDLTRSEADRIGIYAKRDIKKIFKADYYETVGNRNGQEVAVYVTDKPDDGEAKNQGQTGIDPDALPTKAKAAAKPANGGLPNRAENILAEREFAGSRATSPSGYASPQAAEAANSGTTPPARNVNGNGVGERTQPIAKTTTAGTKPNDASAPQDGQATAPSGDQSGDATKTGGETDKQGDTKEGDDANKGNASN